MKRICMFGTLMCLFASCDNQLDVVDEIDKEVSMNDSASLMCKDMALENEVWKMLQEGMTEYSCEKGNVYVVETASGAIKAKVSLIMKGNGFIPYEDTFNNERCDILMAPTYLTLLSIGEKSPKSYIDIGFGVYKDVKDHNWRKGGYGVVTMEEALYYWSRVAFTKFKEETFGNNTTTFDNTISFYLAGMPDNPMGILTFYNAVANDGKMVKLRNEGNSPIVLNEQIAEPEHVKALQKGLRHAVEFGLYKRSGRNYTSVSACGRTFLIDVNKRRMELCGFFPSDKPLYTIMVILEKEELPASAGGMCSLIMSRTIDSIVELYNLKPILNRYSEELEDTEIQNESEVVCDTVAAVTEYS